MVMEKGNVYKNARLKAAKKKSQFKNVALAFQELGIRREKLLHIEQTDSKKEMEDPSPEEVVIMAREYDAPELCNYYCTKQCPIGKGTPTLIHDNLNEISTRLMTALHFLQGADDKIYKILEDGIITDDERRDLKQIIETLNKIAYSASSLELWAKKNGYVE